MGKLGRTARRRWAIPARDGWRVLRRVAHEVVEDNLDLVAAGIAYYWLLSVFPALVAAVSIWGLVADPSDVQRLVRTLADTLPAEARAVLGAQMTTLASDGRTALTLGSVFGILTALCGATKGTRALMEGLNIAYGAREGRTFLARNAHAVLLLLGVLLTGIAATAGVIVFPAAWETLGLGQIAASLRVGRWPLLGLGMVGFLAVAYRYGPCRDEPRWAWVSVGALPATILWLTGSALFSAYVGRFARYSEVYGSLAGVVVLLLWFWMTAFVVLLGAELNHELERHIGGLPPRPGRAPGGEPETRGADDARDPG